MRLQSRGLNHNLLAALVKCSIRRLSNSFQTNNRLWSRRDSDKNGPEGKCPSDAHAYACRRSGTIQISSLTNAPLISAILHSRCRDQRGGQLGSTLPSGRIHARTMRPARLFSFWKAMRMSSSPSYSPAPPSSSDNHRWRHMGKGERRGTTFDWFETDTRLVRRLWSQQMVGGEMRFAVIMVVGDCPNPRACPVSSATGPWMSSSLSSCAASRSSSSSSDWPRASLSSCCSPQRYALQ